MRLYCYICDKIFFNLLFISKYIYFYIILRTIYSFYSIMLFALFNKRIHIFNLLSNNVVQYAFIHDTMYTSSW